MLVVDASALVAIGLREPEALEFQAILSQADAIAASSVNLMEAGLALVLRNVVFTRPAFFEWLRELDVIEIHVDAGDVLAAYLAFGRGVHRAGLNLGDCYAYALAKRLDAPLLYKGNDFARTDIKAAYQPT